MESARAPRSDYHKDAAASMALTDKADKNDNTITTNNTQPMMMMTQQQQQQQQQRSSTTTRHREQFSSFEADTNSDAFSKSSDGQYEVIEYDLAADAGSGEARAAAASTSAASSSDVFRDVGRVSIEEDSPAAAALRANAAVFVSKAGKAARAVHMQSVRRALKRAAGKRQSGVKKGKPPRVPPPGSGSSTLPHLAGVVIDEDEEYESGVSEEEDDDDMKERGFEVILDVEDDSDLSDASPVKKAVAMADESNKKQQQLQQQQATAEKPEYELSHMPDGVAPGTVEAGKKVLGSVDPHDLLKLVRWRRKKKGAIKMQKSYVKGKVIDGEHELYTLSIAVMIGVRTSISRTNTELNTGPGRRWVRPADFRATEKYEFRPKGDGPLPPHQLAHTFKFKDYAPVVFAYMRRMYGVNEFDFLLSVCGNANFIEFISNAKSGQFFFYSSDGRYMIKTMTNAESKFLRRALPQYFKHCCENPNTMITRFFGMYRVKLYHLRRNVKFVIMNSVYYTDKILHTFYDLKGSSVGRDAKPGQAVLKDNDLRRSLPEGALALRPKQRAAVRAQLVSDCSFLERVSIMDYSMLVGVHNIPPFDDKGTVTGSVNRKMKGTRPRKNSASSFHDADHSDTEASVTKTTPGDSSVTAPPSPHSKGKRNPGHIRSRSDTTRSIEDGLEDDDNSYLIGSENRPGIVRTFNEETEHKKQVTIEKLFWPFHHLYDIHGHRRLEPAKCPNCKDKPCDCFDKDRKLLEGYNIPKFVPPLSDRKDGGLEMDLNGLQLPIKYNGPSGEQLCEGKIFYMGIIDVLQEYNTRKFFESRYRKLQSPLQLAASCVPPHSYGQRFIEFYDEFTQRDPTTKDEK